MKLGIVIATYQRKDGTTPFFLQKALDSIFSQTYQNFKIFLIGDKYEDNEEFVNIISKYPQDKIYYENLPYAKERDSYTDKWVLWSYGGITAMNFGIEKALEEGYDFICHLDHDDWWLPNHLEVINDCINKTNADWICTKSIYLNPNKTMPVINGKINEFIEFLPSYSKLIHSSVCMNFKKIPLKYRDIFEETQKLGLPADGDLWDRCNQYITKHKLKSYCINTITCSHNEEGYERK